MAAKRLVTLYLAHEQECAPDTRAAVLQSFMDAEAYALSIHATASRLMAGGHIGAEASTNKIFWSEMDIQLHRTALSILGARAELTRGAPAAGDVDRWLDGYFFSLAGPIYAGSNEIQKNIIAERMLGLPK
jgi:alkylation response protein AidB-like acyl-CoA dehydrogenase